MATTTYFGWTTPDNTALVKDGASAIRTLGSAIDSSMSQLEGGTTGQILSKTSGTDMAFTWIANDVGDITAVTAGTGISGGGTSGAVTVSIDTAVTVDKTTAQTLTNKTLTSPSLTTPTISTATTNGDLLYGTGSGALARLGIGSSAQVLTVASGVPSWATAASGGSMTLLGSPLTLSGTPTITGIDQTYKDLYFLCFGFTNGSTGDTVFIPNSIQLLVDYVMTANSNNAAATEVKTADNIQFNLGANRQTAGSAVNFFALTIKDYASTTNRKVWNLSASYTAASGRVNSQTQGSINTNNAITEMFIAHSVSGFTGGTVETYGVN